MENYMEIEKCLDLILTDEETIKELNNLLPEAKVAAIKYIREKYDLDLAGAKTIIDKFLNNQLYLTDEERSFEIKEVINYIGGHPKLTKQGSANIKISNNEINITVGLFSKSTVSVPLEKIKSIKFESGAELKSRITLTRLMLLGPLGLFLKKKSADKKYFLSIDCDGFSLCFSDDSSKLVNKVFQQIYDIWNSYQENHKKIDKKQKNDKEAKSLSNYEELIELKKLLDLGIITKNEFDQKKKSILGI